MSSTSVVTVVVVAILASVGFAWYRFKRDRLSLGRARRYAALGGLVAMSIAAIGLVGLELNTAFPKITDTTVLFRWGRASWSIAVVAFPLLLVGKGWSRIAGVLADLCVAGLWSVLLILA